MYALLRLQFDLQKQTLLFLLVGLFIILICIFTFTFSSTNLSFLGFILSINLLTSSTFLSNNNFYHILHTMPIKREHIVKSSVLSSSLLVTIIFTILLPFQIKEGVAHENVQENVGMFIGFFSSALLANIVQHYFIFTNEKLQISWGENTLTLFGSIFFVMFPHALFYFNGPEETFYLRMMIMPLITCVLYYFILKKTIRHYKTKEFF